MKESIGQAFIVNLILIFFIVLSVLLFSSINYSKAFKVKNRIINIIEKYNGWGNYTQAEVEKNLSNAAYNISLPNEDCNKYKKNVDYLVYPAPADTRLGRYYDYCVFENKGTDINGAYNGSNAHFYKVITFVQIDIPIINSSIKFAVRGETKLMYDNIK